MSIHPTVIITGDVQISRTAIIDPYAVITGPCVIEDDVYIGPHAVIGAPPHHHGSYPSPILGSHKPRGVRIERGATIREHAQVHQGIVVETRIGENALIMAGSHIAHDCEIGARVTAGSYLILGGFTMIGNDATFGQGCVTHPWIIVGEGAMVGLNSSVIRDVEPFEKVAGAPIRTLGQNTKKLDETILNTETWEQHAQMSRTRDARKAAWYA